MRESASDIRGITDAVHLCIDMQNISAPGGVWATPWMERVLPTIASIVSRHHARTIFTRFITPEDPEGRASALSYSFTAAKHTFVEWSNRSAFGTLMIRHVHCRAKARDANATARSARSTGERHMSMRRRVKQVDTLEARLAAEAARLREEASLLPPGAAREQVLRKARQAETGSQMSEWLRSPGLQPPA